MSCIILHVFAGKSEVWGRGGGLVVSLVGADVLGVQQVHGRLVAQACVRQKSCGWCGQQCRPSEWVPTKVWFSHPCLNRIS